MSDLRALLTRKLLPYVFIEFEISGGCEKNCASFTVILGKLEVLQNNAFGCTVNQCDMKCGWKVIVNGILLISSFSDVCSADCRSIYIKEM